MLDITKLAEWVFRRVGQRGNLRPYALAAAFGLHWVPVHAAMSRLVGTRIELPRRASEARKRRQIMRECARAVLRHHGVTDDDRSADALAGLLIASSCAPALELVRMPSFQPAGESAEPIDTPAHPAVSLPV